MLRAAPESTHEILYAKLKDANVAIHVSEARALAAERDAQRVVQTATSELATVTAALRLSEEGRRVAEARVDELSRPDGQRLKEVQAMELSAHAARKAVAECCDDTAASALEEEARFQTDRARQARHCLTTGTAVPRAVAVHMYVGAEGAKASHDDDASDAADLARLELSVAMERALDRSATASGIGARHGGSAAGSRSERTDRYVRAVSLDLQEGLHREAEAYAAAQQAAPEATPR